MIEVISGTNRPGCNCIKIARIVESLYREQGADVQILNLQDLPPEIFHPDSYAKKPDSFLPFQERVLRADGLHIVTPEYNGGFPGVLKYFIDMLKFPESFEYRPVAFTGEAAGMWGAIRPIEMLQLIFGYRNAHRFPLRVFISDIGHQLDENDQLKDEGIHKRLREQTAGFIEFVDRLKGMAPKEIRKK